VRDLIDWVGRDAVRYFYLMRKGDSHLVFDVDLARSESDENPDLPRADGARAHVRHLPPGRIDAAAFDASLVDWALLASRPSRS
jgi:arginyl-tRNA synthetase